MVRHHEPRRRLAQLWVHHASAVHGIYRGRGWLLPAECARVGAGARLQARRTLDVFRARPTAAADRIRGGVLSCDGLVSISGRSQPVVTMPKRSAAILLWKRVDERLQVLLVHPGGPFWRNKDAGAWSLPKGEYGEGELALAAARREAIEELGPSAGWVATAPANAFVPLGEVKQKGGKQVAAFALEGDFDPAQLQSNTFEIEWPPRSGRKQSFPEVDRAEWFGLAAAQEKILQGQLELLMRADKLL